MLGSAVVSSMGNSVGVHIRLKCVCGGVSGPIISLGVGECACIHCQGVVLSVCGWVLAHNQPLYEGTVFGPHKKVAL